MSGKVIAKIEIWFIVILLVFLTIFTYLRIRSDYATSPLGITTKNLTILRKSINIFYEKYKTFPTEDEIKGQDKDKKFYKVLKKELPKSFIPFRKTTFPKTAEYTKEIREIKILIAPSGRIKIVKKLENLGLDRNAFSSNGGWIYCPLNGEIRANLQNNTSYRKVIDLSRPDWGRNIDWYFE